MFQYLRWNPSNDDIVREITLNLYVSRYYAIQRAQAFRNGPYDCSCRNCTVVSYRAGSYDDYVASYPYLWETY